MVYTSRRGDIELPHLDLLSLLFDSGWCWAREETKIHVEAANPSNSITKDEARKLVKRIAHVLRHRFGVGASGAGKDAVLTVLYGSPFAPVFFYGLVAAGGVYCGASTDSQIAELVRQIQDANATVLVCSSDCEAKVVESAGRCGIPRDRVLILDSTRPQDWKLFTVTDRSNLLNENVDQMLEWERITDQRRLQDITTCLLYSSGTTGLPKGVQISHWGLVANNICSMDVARRYQRQTEKEGRKFQFSTIAHLPMANIAGIILYSINPFYMGGTTWWMKKFDFNLFLEYHRRFRPEYQFTVPPIWLRIAKSDEVTDQFDALQVAVTGSAPVGFETIKDVRKKLGRGQAHMAQTWGITECCGVVTAQDWPSYANEGIWSVGEPLPNVSIRIVDENDHDVEAGQPGELLVSGPILAQGYLNRSDANKEAFSDGFYRTGDIGTYQDGLIRIVDRKKELIKYKGSQVAPAELEALLNSHPQIADAAVIGIWDDERQTEVPRGYVVRRTSLDGRSVEAITEQEVVDFVKQNTASHKHLRGGIFFLDEIPKSASGKILRKELRQKASQNRRAKL